MEYPQFVVKSFFNEGLGNMIKVFFTLLSFDKNSKIQNTDDYMFGNYDTIFADKHIYKGNGENVLYLTGCRFTLLKEDEEGQEDLSYYSTEIDNDSINNVDFYKYFPISNFKIDMCYDPSKISTKIKNKFLNIKTSVSYTEIINQKIHNLNKTRKTLGISVRTWNCKHESNIYRDYDFDLYKVTINDVLIKHDINQIILSIDNHENNDYLDPYIQLFKQLNINYTILYHDSDLNELQNAFIKMYKLSLCEYFICNRISTFSELVFWYSNLEIKVYTVC